MKKKSGNFKDEAPGIQGEDEKPVHPENAKTGTIRLQQPRSTMRVLVYFPKFSIHFIRFAAKIAKPAAPLAVNGT
jgi:hypothetical protein